MSARFSHTVATDVEMLQQSERRQCRRKIREKTAVFVLCLDVASQVKVKVKVPQCCEVAECGRKNNGT